MSIRLPKRPIAAFLRRQRDGATWKPDAVREVRYDLQWTVTDHPVERGLSVTDHVQAQPQSITITCVISENPTAPAEGGRVHLRKMLAWLRETADAGDLVDVLTHKLGVSRNYVIKAAPHGIDKVSRLVFDLELREVRFATVSSIEISVEDVAEDVAAGAPDEVDTGEQATTSTGGTPEADEAEDSDQSVLSSLVDAL